MTMILLLLMMMMMLMLMLMMICQVFEKSLGAAVPPPSPWSIDPGCCASPRPKHRGSLSS